MHAIPTSYAGVNFRSRLEARWAAFFDLLGWRWEYEPIDLAGYIPDFILRFREPLLVEVKPILWQCSDPPRPEIDAVREKIDRSGWDGPSLLLGAQFRNDWIVGLGRLGPSAPGHQQIAGNWTSAGFSILGAFEPSGEWLFSYGYDEHPDIPLIQVDPQIAWREAGNRVQWKPPA